MTDIDPHATVECPEHGTTGVLACITRRKLGATGCAGCAVQPGSQPKPEKRKPMPSKKGICKQCQREMYLPGRGLCGKCYAQVLKKEKQAQGPEPTQPEPAQREQPQPEPPAEAPRPEPAADEYVLTVRFEGRDRQLFSLLLEAAQAARRSPTQQALWYLERALATPSEEGTAP